MKAIAPVMANVRDRVGRRVHPIAARTSRDAEEAPVHLAKCKKSGTPEGRPLPPPPMFHSTPLPALHRLSSDLPEPSSAHLSFNQSQSSLPPLDLGGGDGRPMSSTGTPIQGSAPLCCRSIITIRLCTHCEFLQRPYQANIQSRL